MITRHLSLNSQSRPLSQRHVIPQTWEQSELRGHLHPGPDTHVPGLNFQPGPGVDISQEEKKERKQSTFIWNARLTGKIKGSNFTVACAKGREEFSD